MQQEKPSGAAEQKVGRREGVREEGRKKERTNRGCLASVGWVCLFAACVVVCLDDAFQYITAFSS